MMQRVRKLFVGVVHLAILSLIVFTLLGWTGVNLGLALSTASLGWLLLTLGLLPKLLETYEDHLSRFQIFLPLIASLACSPGLFFIEPYWPRAYEIFVGAFFFLEVLACWAGVLFAVRQRCQDFTWQGHGPLPKNVWLNPPAAALQEGDVVLTAGPKARTMRDSVVHAELIIAGRKPGRLMAFSSYIAQGAVLNTARSMVKVEQVLGDHFIVLRLRQPFTPEQSARAIEIADNMLAANDAWRKAKTARRVNLVRWLPIPARLKNWLLNEYAVSALVKKRPPSHAELWQIWLHRRVWPTGYDFWGNYTGSTPKDHWTCMAADLEMLRRLGVPVRRYGSGFLGLGTGILNPLMPIRLMSDPCYRLVTMDDKATYDAGAATEAEDSKN